MLFRSYEIVSIRPEAGELLVRYVEAGHDVTLNLPPPASTKDFHRHVLRHWPRPQFLAKRILQELVDDDLSRRVEISTVEVEVFGLEDIDE